MMLFSTDRSMYGGVIEGIGPRYRSSIAVKVMPSDVNSHQIFIVSSGRPNDARVIPEWYFNQFAV
ncbi:hypothetical protein O9992_09205 [Vibrio lentus]|nr:hypothetical protein [Vibrio lentus]